MLYIYLLYMLYIYYIYITVSLYRSVAAENPGPKAAMKFCIATRSASALPERAVSVSECSSRAVSTWRPQTIDMYRKNHRKTIGKWWFNGI